VTERGAEIWYPLRVRSSKALLIAAAIAVAPWSLSPSRAQACAPAPREGEVVRIAEESAVIYWDSARRIEHFVRRARFDTTASDFGFLVPTPTLPTLAEASQELFSTLDDVIKPEVRYESRTRLVPGISCMMFMMSASRGRGAASSAAPVAQALDPVRVLAAQTVAGYDAVVLEADNADALAQWLTTRGYANSPTLQRWLAPYVAQRWKITAFRVAKPDANRPGAPATSPVRMTFAAERPFYPYREPEDQRAGTGSGRTLRVHVLSTERMHGTIGDRGVWPGRVLYSNTPTTLAARLGTTLGAAIPAGTWLTTFDDRSSPRLGTDEVYFASSSDRSPVIPPAIVRTNTNEIPIPLDWVALIGFVLWVVWRRVRKARTRSGTTAS